jgi:NADH-quinone oxidoreductase subunit N
VFFFSLAGIPPLAGWFAKFAMFRSVILAGGTATVVLAIIAAINAVIALYYYARVVKAVWLDPPPEGVEIRQQRPPANSLSLVLAITLVLTVVIGFYPTIATVFGDAAKVLTATVGG